LLVATATRWFGAARSPRALSRAGFDVSVLVPRGALAAASGYLTGIGYVPDNASALEWFDARRRRTTPAFQIDRGRFRYFR
jgi:hypothetical protein